MLPSGLTVRETQVVWQPVFQLMPPDLLNFPTVVGVQAAIKRFQRGISPASSTLNISQALASQKTNLVFSFQCLTGPFENP